MLISLKPNIVFFFEIFPADMESQRRQLTPEQDALEHIVACRDKPFLEEIYIDAFKGRRNIFDVTLY